jgi:hypothetical protein
MAIYLVSRRITFDEKLEVEAASKEEAISRARRGEWTNVREAHTVGRTTYRKAEKT